MKNLKQVIFVVIIFITVIQSGCTTTSSIIDRPIKRVSQRNWDVLGSVRLETLVGISETNQSIPYDQLLKKAHEKYGDLADVIEIKIEKQNLSFVEKSTFYKDEKKSYSYRMIYNAVVIKYLPY